MGALQWRLADGQALPVTRAGQGEQVVVLIHGWTCQRKHWQWLLANPPAGYTLLAVDLPGHGEARDVTVPAWTVVALADCLADALKDIDNPILAGHSMGGAVALELARRKSVKGVVLVDTFVIPYGDLDEDGARGVESAFYDDFPAAIDSLVANNAGPDLPADQKAALARDMASAPAEAMLPLWSDLLRWSPEAAFSEITCPVHAINGDLIGDVARARCEGHVTEWLQPGTWHFPQMEQPDIFAGLFGRVLHQL
ncbi:alpha/beta fold hydrolase [Alcanivorax sp. DP30]|uniref:alpha/beta fold hydrolase n=1 Tax=Alcanivorax sp. DP30 TaxID=2606217 RepID=UPI00136BEF47|nr:alpha/beta hydrolase [Alcanivorax sp. DP30]MZR63280.1 alpha/beta fold hydrolase [Alcanivorax sp. DP30]